MKLKQKNSPEQLWVEGPNDLHVIATTWQESRKEDPRNHFFIQESGGGYTNLRKILPTILTPDKPGPVGMVVDADQSFADRWQSMRERLIEIGYQVPPEMDPAGLVIAHDDLPRVGLWIWPNNQDAGLLEDYLRVLIPAHDTLLPEVESCLTHLKQGGLQRFPDIRVPKALIHTWLAWQEVPGSPYGIAIKSSYLDTSHPLSQGLIAWLNHLFNPSDSPAV
jgi:hypothetical protein